MKNLYNTKISIFSGGSGNLELNKNLYKILGENLTIIINGYDDGKSTGLLREIVPGMLGPSDFRKNIVNLIDETNFSKRSLKYLLNFRLNTNNLNEIKKIFKLDLSFNQKFHKKFTMLSYSDYEVIKESIIYLKNNIDINKINKKDINFGNLVFTSMYIKYALNFDNAIEKFKDLCDVKANILNVTNGKNLYLCGIDSQNNFISNEEKITNGNFKNKIKDIFLIKKKIQTKDIINNLKNLEKYLKKISFYPKMNMNVKIALIKSDIILYGSGTQFSSLFPSYITRGLFESLVRSKAKKFFISNIVYDKDIKNLKFEEILEKFYFYINFKNKKKYKEKLIDYFILNKFDDENLSIKDKKNYITPNSNIKNSIIFDFEKKDGVHFSNELINIILKKSSISSINLKTFNSYSLIIPILNEKRTVKKVIKNLINFNYKNYFKEIIVVDGGSTDGSLKILNKFKDIRLYSLKNVGRGECIRYGILKSRCDLIGIFPSDDEYYSEDIKKLFNQITENKFDLSIGSRLIKCQNIKNQIKQIYPNNYFGYLLSKYGGFFLSLLLFFKHNKFITDSLTTIFALKSIDAKKINFKSKGVNFNLELICKYNFNNKSIIEIPVQFKARSFKQGKKITMYDGLKCVLEILKN